MCNFCKFCINAHTPDCPRDTPGANERYNIGWHDGSRYLEPNSDDLAYLAGWRRGDSEADALAEEAAAANDMTCWL
jgi:hypothetical protein